MTKHKTFTDFLFVYENGVIKGFIEVKKRGLSADLNAATNETAQAIREAHILLLEKNIPREANAFVCGGERVRTRRRTRLHANARLRSLYLASERYCI